MKVIGKVKVIEATGTFGDSGFRKRNLIVVTDEQYPQSILIEFVQDKVDLLDAFKTADSVEVSINLRGREWTNPEGVTKYFNSIQGWQINKAGAPAPAPAGATAPTEPDDLPF